MTKEQEAAVERVKTEILTRATDFEKYDRTTSIGASEVAPLFGLPVGRFQGPFSIWQRKRGTMDEPALSGPATRGQIGEGMILEQFSAMFPDMIVFKTARLTFQGAQPHRSASPDGIVILADGRIAVVDAKWPGRRMIDEWGDPEDPEGAPLRYRIQLQAQMQVLGLDLGCLVVPLDIDQWEWGVYWVPRDEALCAKIDELVEDFWQRCVVGGEPPEVDGSDQEREWIARTFPGSRAASKKRIEVPQTQELKHLLATRSLVADRESECKVRKGMIDAALRQIIGEDYGFEAFGSKLSCGVQERWHTDWAALAAAKGITQAEIDEFTTGKKIRVLRVTQPKKEPAVLMEEASRLRGFGAELTSMFNAIQVSRGITPADIGLDGQETEEQE